ncbi:MAG: M23 family metallopeptidase [Actinobacteria bacterium]|nr:M23 family metallopeptidase [Actinomycetota bacterium]
MVVLVLASLGTSGTWSAGASDCLLGVCLDHDTTPPTPSPPPPGESPAPGPPPQPAPKPGDPVGPAPAPAAVPPGPGGAPPVPGEPPPPPPLPGDGEEPPADAGPFPENLRRLQNSVKRSGASNTKALMEALAPLGDYGVSPEEAALIGFGRFPVAGQANYTHDWWFPRFGPGWRLHMGTDIFAAMGAPVRSPSEGKVRITNGGLGGLAVYVVEPDGTFWYLAHLSGLAEGLSQGTPVTVGQVVGFVGDSGNARGGSPHVHAEYHPRGGAAVDPKAILDQFLADAVAEAPALIQRYADAAGAAAGAQLDLPGLEPPGRATEPVVEAPRSALLWASAMSPSGGALALAEAEAARIAGTVEWESVSRGSS